MRRWLDRVLTGEVLCRNCPAYREHATGLGTCGRDAPFFVATLPGWPSAEVLPIKRAAIDWCAHHPLHQARRAPDLYYAPGELGRDEVAGFNRVPSLADALQFAPDTGDSRRAATAMRDCLNSSVLNKAVNKDPNSS